MNVPGTRREADNRASDTLVCYLKSCLKPFYNVSAGLKTKALWTIIADAMSRESGEVSSIVPFRL